jgi:hypothetical protein
MEVRGSNPKVIINNLGNVRYQGYLFNKTYLFLDFLIVRI